MFNTNSKSWRTSAVAMAGLVLSLCILAIVFTGKATLTEATPAFAGLGALLAVINGFLAKDAKATHSRSSATIASNILEGNDPKKEEK